MLRRPGPPPPVGVSRVGTALSWFPDGPCGKGTRGAQTPQQGLVGVRGPLAVSCLSVPGLVSVIRGPCSPSCPPVSPGWVGVGAGDLSLAACLPSETLGVGADAAVSYGPPTPMLLLCLGSGCGPPPPTWPSLGGPPHLSQGLLLGVASSRSAKFRGLSRLWKTRGESQCFPGHQSGREMPGPLFLNL